MLTIGNYAYRIHKTINRCNYHETKYCIRNQKYYNLNNCACKNLLNEHKLIQHNNNYFDLEPNKTKCFLSDERYDTEFWEILNTIRQNKNILAKLIDSHPEIMDKLQVMTSKSLEKMRNDRQLANEHKKTMMNIFASVCVGLLIALFIFQS
jgi:hypothetical protein